MQPHHDLDDLKSIIILTKLSMDSGLSAEESLKVIHQQKPTDFNRELLKLCKKVSDLESLSLEFRLKHENNILNRFLYFLHYYSSIQSREWWPEATELLREPIKNLVEECLLETPSDSLTILWYLDFCLSQGLSIGQSFKVIESWEKNCYHSLVVKLSQSDNSDHLLKVLKVYAKEKNDPFLENLGYGLSVLLETGGNIVAYSSFLRRTQVNFRA
ncbi:MAG: hypothetical protein K9K67_12420 [Bacteriovoracaceae bacterium]|nr:hypothetical protein [Bacteriovoracaceae bacterium]